LFKNASDATGLLDVTVVECTNVPAGDFVKPHPTARASVVFNVTDLKLDGPVPQILSSALRLGGRGIDGDIKKGSIGLSNGVASTDFALLLKQYAKERDARTGEKRTRENALPMVFNGSVELASGDLRGFF